MGAWRWFPVRPGGASSLEWGLMRQQSLGRMYRVGVAWAAALLLQAGLATPVIGQGQVTISAQVTVGGQGGIPSGSDDTEQSNQPTGFTLAKPPPTVGENLDDFERYRDKKAWTKAFAALEKVQAEAHGGMLPLGGNFFVPAQLKIRRELLSLPPEGRQAYRIFRRFRPARRRAATWKVSSKSSANISFVRWATARRIGWATPGLRPAISRPRRNAGVPFSRIFPIRR